MGCKSSTPKNATMEPHYDRKYKLAPPPFPEKDPNLGESDCPMCTFFTAIRHKLDRDYVVLVDRSFSMMCGDKWNQAKEAVRKLAGVICEFDTDGATLIMFDNEIQKFDHIRDSDRILMLFNAYTPQGTTDLAKALDTAFKDHFEKRKGATSILVITDGSPDDDKAAEFVVAKAANSVLSLSDLTVSFIQIGRDHEATDYLKYLDDHLKCKYDIVDTINCENMVGVSFDDLITSAASGQTLVRSGSSRAHLMQRTNDFDVDRAFTHYDVVRRQSEAGGGKAPPRAEDDPYYVPVAGGTKEDQKLYKNMFDTDAREESMGSDEDPPEDFM